MQAHAATRRPAIAFTLNHTVGGVKAGEQWPLLNLGRATATDTYPIIVSSRTDKKIQEHLRLLSVASVTSRARTRGGVRDIAGISTGEVIRARPRPPFTHAQAAHNVWVMSGGSNVQLFTINETAMMRAAVCAVAALAAICKYASGDPDVMNETGTCVHVVRACVRARGCLAVTSAGH
jgi:hypothetical protein